MIRRGNGRVKKMTSQVHWNFGFSPFPPSRPKYAQLVSTSRAVRLIIRFVQNVSSDRNFRTIISRRNNAKLRNITVNWSYRTRTGGKEIAGREKRSFGPLQCANRLNRKIVLKYKYVYFAVMSIKLLSKKTEQGTVRTHVITFKLEGKIKK